VRVDAGAATREVRSAADEYPTFSSELNQWIRIAAAAIATEVPAVGGGAA